MVDLTGKRALVTGAGSGAGFGIATVLAAAGAEIVAVGRTASRLEKLRGEVEGAGGKVLVVPGDLGSREGAREVARQAGEIDILVNCAAYTDVKWQPFLVDDDAGWDAEFAVNVTAPVTLMKALMPGMVKRGHGVVINISSTGVRRPNPLHAAYSASKSALEVVSQAAALEVAPNGVRVNVIGLGLTDTESLHASVGDDAAIAAMGKMLVPAGRANTPKEVGEVCLFLCSDAAATIVGAILMLDGGITAGIFDSNQGFSAKAEVS